MLFEHDPPLSCVLEFLLRRAGAQTRMNPISLKSANPPDGRRAKAAIRLENRQALGLPPALPQAAVPTAPLDISPPSAGALSPPPLERPVFQFGPFGRHIKCETKLFA